ncbi:MAG: protein kinase [Phycisphaera sp.]|nr:protein kinase [Phycisphaera sp.]
MSSPAPHSDHRVLMFTDLVDSARMKVRLGDVDYALNVARPHNQMFHRIIADTPGAEEVAYTGDGFFAWFTTVGDAINAALRFQHQMRTYPWQAMQPRTRIGIHLGTVLLIGDGETSAIIQTSHAADVCARLMSLAAGGQILLTQAAFEAGQRDVPTHPPIEDGRSPDLEWRRHGRYYFKGRDEPVEVFEVGAKDHTKFDAPVDSEKAWRDNTMNGSMSSPANRYTPTLGPGRRVGKYEIVGFLGKGGMGTVYTANDTTLDRPVALKVLPRDVAGDSIALRRFQREGRLAARLHHPNAVTIFDIGHDPEQQVHYIAMELVRGADAHHLLQERGPFDVTTATASIADACRVLAVAHNAGLIHRDIKPGNLMHADDGTVKIADFGLARGVAGEGGLSLTGKDEIIGSPNYMSPEQCRGETIDTRADLYALGCTYFALLTGHPPYVYDSPMKTMHAHVSEPPPSVRQLRPDAPASCGRIIERAMAKSRDQRYQTADEMLEALNALLSELRGAASQAPR